MHDKGAAGLSGPPVDWSVGFMKMENLGDKIIKNQAIIPVLVEKRGHYPFIAANVAGYFRCIVAGACIMSI